MHCSIEMHRNDMEQAYEPTSSGLASGALDFSVVTVVVVTSKFAKSAALICNVQKFYNYKKF